jgi:hypothetical protein
MYDGLYEHPENTYAYVGGNPLTRFDRKGLLFGIDDAAEAGFFLYTGIEGILAGEELGTLGGAAFFARVGAAANTAYLGNIFAFLYYSAVIVTSGFQPPPRLLYTEIKSRVASASACAS